MQPKKTLAPMFLVACLLIGQASGIASTMTYFSVSFGGSTLWTEIDAPAYSFKQFLFTAPASSDSSVLQFTFRNDPGYYNLDDVVVVPVTYETTVYSPCGDVSGNLVANCSFGTGNFTDWTGSGDTGFVGVDSVSPFATLPYSGNAYEASIGPTGDTGGIYQTITTVPGMSYDISFFLEDDGCQGECTPDPTPEPAPAALFMTGLGGLGLLLVRRRR